MSLRRVFIPLLVFICTVFPLTGAADAAELDRPTIDNYVTSMMDKDNLPGVSVAIVNGSESYTQGYGFSDLAAGRKVTPYTLFELGSNSKAFTALGILLLTEQGKIDLKAPVTRYLPWTEWKFGQEKVEPTVEDFLHQTSGMGSNSIALIPPSNHDKALADTVRNLAAQPLWYKPGEQFLYSTGNYDVLGAVIEAVSGQSYESFMASQVIKPLGLDHTYAGTAALPPDVKLSSGYKLGFTGNRQYNAPTYRGNIPAGYILSNATDMAQWLKNQLGQPEGVPESLRRAVKQSHAPDNRVRATLTEPYDSPFRYGGGWLVFDQARQPYLSHSGNNPNFSSYVILDPNQKIGIAVMGNRNSTYTYAIAQGLRDLLTGKQPVGAYQDTTTSVNLGATIVFIIADLLCIWMLYRTLKVLFAIRRGRRSFAGHSAGVYLKSVLWAFLGIVILGAAWYIPQQLFWGYSWPFIIVWAPFTVLPAMISVGVTAILFAGLRITSTLFPRKHNDRPANLPV
ncbi:serine hydrolase [Paenibacillus sp. J22TS3]|uniref:serine hydrolase domain-containing protein n=1 Tax=Paenibacillus sp. J22TS3 TaxID=2807192 RepID=UPI001B10D27B|nr:serine hydrolase domain-containing protein [Paenibacillus sp. J22TS3]GIP23202.1 serine hydrolase [Paenibacillus sp. J22TS3]